MDPLGFNPAFPFPVPTTADINLQLQPPIISDLHHSQNPEMNKEANAVSKDQPASAGHSSHRKRGRPRKLKPTTEPNFEPAPVQVESAVSNGAPVEEVSEALPEKRAARPVKRFGSEIVHRDVAVKKKKGVLMRGPLGYPKRGPGRPPKSRPVAGVFNALVDTSAVAGVKRRGRPKGSVSDKLEEAVPKNIGWHNKKVESRVLGPADPQWMVDYAHIRAKIDHVQSRMRKAIGVIKTHLMNQIITNGHIGTALQELDQLSTMDVMAVSLGGLVEEPEAHAETQFF